MSDKYQKAPKGYQQNDSYNRSESENDPHQPGQSEDGEEGDEMSEQQSKSTYLYSLPPFSNLNNFGPR